MSVEEEQSGGIPEWVVTFGDMMSLLLTFFIMLVSLSEIKEEEHFQALVESFRRQFGHDSSIASLAPGNSRPRNALLAKLALLGRARRFDTHRGGDKVSAPSGDHPRVLIVRHGIPGIGTVITFPEGSPHLSEQNKEILQKEALEIGGKPQKIEIRGHTSQRPVPKDSGFRDHWDLAFARCRAAMDYLVELGIDRKRIRMTVAGANEPVSMSTDPAKWKQNPRVEIIMLGETVGEHEGTEDEKEKRFTGEKDT